MPLNAYSWTEAFPLTWLAEENSRAVGQQMQARGQALLQFEDRGFGVKVLAANASTHMTEDARVGLLNSEGGAACVFMNVGYDSAAGL